MQDFVIITDSSADLNAKMVQELEVDVLPLSFLMEGISYQNFPDNREIDPHAFYDKLRGGATATTNAVNVGQATDTMVPLLEKGKDILVLGFSSGLSTTFSSMQIAVNDLSERYPERKIYAVDTLCASLGQGLLVWHAVQRQRAGDTIEQVRDWVEENKLRICHWFTVEDLMFLKRGGRVSSATAFMGTMLSIKPVLHVDNEGHLINITKVRGRKASLITLVDKMEATAVDPDRYPVFISHGDCLKDAQFVADEVKKRFGTKDIFINHVGPVIGAHAGPGVIALFFMGKTR